MHAVFTYGSGLERDSPRFTEIGSFFVYVAFVMALIVVSAPLWCCLPDHSFVLLYTYTTLNYFVKHLHISAHPNLKK